MPIVQNLNVIFNVSILNGDTLPEPDWFDFTAAGNSDQEILQCVTTLMYTPIGSVVGNRLIGVDYSFVDKPMDVAIPMILAAIPDAINKWEPRCSVHSITFSSTVSDMESLGKIQVNLTIQIPAASQ